jgi:hypothetical protein
MDLPTGELVVRNGKRKGARLPLRAPVTVIGSADGCDVKLTADGLGPVHCAVVLAPDGVALRSWHPDATWVNGEARAEAALTDGDEVRVGPCVFQVALADPPPAPPEDALEAEAAQLAEVIDGRRKQVEAHEEQLAAARSALRAERDQAAADRAGAARLKREAAALHREADRERDRSRKTVARFVRQFEYKWADTRRQFEGDLGAFAAEKERHAAAVARFEAARSDLHIQAAADRDRRREAWAAVEARQKRVAAEWAEANEVAAKREAALDARAAELAAREKALTGGKRKLEKETAALRKEADGLEARAQHAREVVEELERKRDRLRADLLTPSAAAPGLPISPEVPLNRAADRDLAVLAEELDRRERELNQERAGLKALAEQLGRESADVGDRRKVVAEQFAQLAVARARWQRAERETVEEMESLARGLAHREQELDVRERLLFRADARRREDAYELWQVRLKLEAWHAKLTAYEAGWAADRERAEANVARRVRAVADKEAAIDRLFATWDAVRGRERELFQSELAFWSEARGRFNAAAADHDRQRAELVGELLLHAARAMASEELLTESLPDAKGARAARRLAVLRKRWERAFDRKRREVEAGQAAAARERAATDDRYAELHRLLAGLAERVAAFNDRSARAEAEAVLALPFADEADAPPDHAASAAELAALRAEVERIAAVLMEAELPEAPDGILPWAAEEAGGGAEDGVLQFSATSRAA